MLEENNELGEVLTLKMKTDRNQRNFFVIKLPLRELEDQDKLPYQKFAEIYTRNFTSQALQRCKVFYFFAETNSYLVWNKEVPLERRLFEKGVFQLMVERIRSRS